MLEFLNSTKHQSKNLKDVLIQHPFYLYLKERAGVGHMHVLFFESQFNPKTYFLAFNQYGVFYHSRIKTYKLFMRILNESLYLGSLKHESEITLEQQMVVYFLIKLGFHMIRDQRANYVTCS